MPWKSALDFIGRLRRILPSAAQDEAAQNLAQRHKSFRVFLSAWNDFQETVSDIKYTICCDHPFGLHRVRELCIRVTTQAFQCIQQLKNLDPKPCDTLFDRFTDLQKYVSKELEISEQCLLGAMVLPLGMGALDARLVDPGTIFLESLRAVVPNQSPHPNCGRLGTQEFAQALSPTLSAGRGIAPACGAERADHGANSAFAHPFSPAR